MALVRSNKSSAQQPEGYGEQFVRNVARTPLEVGYQAASGFGLGDILDVLRRNQPKEGFQKYANQALKGLNPVGHLLDYLPSSSQVRGFVEPHLPEYLQAKPEDYGYQFLQQNAVPFALSGGLSSLAGAGKAAAGLAGTHAGSYLGNQAAKQLGAGEQGQLLGSLLGGAGGGLATNIALNRPSKVFPEEIYKKNQSQFNIEQQKKLGEQGKLISNKVNDIRTANKEFGSEVSKLKSNRLRNLESLKKQRSLREARIKELETIRTPLYKQAEKIAPSIAESSPEVKNLLTNLDKNLQGVGKADRGYIYDIANQIEQAAVEGKLSLEDAIIIKKNINARLANKNAFGENRLPAVTENHLKKFNNALNEYIDRVGQANPEHGIPYKKAESATIEKKNLLREYKEFNKAQKLAEKDINNIYKEQLKEAKENHKNIIKDIKLEQKELQQAQDAIGKETYEKAFGTEQKQEQNINKLAEAMTGATRLGRSAGIGYILKLFGFDPKIAGVLGLTSELIAPISQELKTSFKVWKEHPEIFKKYAKQMTKELVSNSPNLINTIERLGSETESLSSEKPARTKGRLVRSI